MDRRARLALAGHLRLAAVLRRGLTVRVTGAKAGRLTLTARRSGVAVARGSAKVRAGRSATVRLRFTARARRSLRHARRVALAVTGAGGALKVTVRR